MQQDLIPTRLVDRAARHPTHIAWQVPGPGGVWISVTWAEATRRATSVARALVAAGLAPGDRVAILGANRPEWVATAWGAMLAGLVPVGIYTASSAEEVGYVLGHSGARLLVVEDRTLWERVRACRDATPTLERIVMMEETPVDDALALTWTAFVATGDTIEEAEIVARTAALTPADLATLIYTSGTTGPPKGVMLSHDNLAATSAVAVHMVAAGPDDRMVSYLPLAHVAEQMFTVHAPPTSGHVIWFGRGLDHLPEDLLACRPTLLFGVPRVWEKLHAKLSTALAEVDGPIGLAIRSAMAAARRAWTFRMDGRPLPWMLKARMAVAAPLLQRIRARAGLDEVRLGVSGAAPVQPSILTWLTGLDLPILEVYGQSEGSGPTTFNRIDRARIGSVGPPVPGCEVRIAEDGEILLRGRNVFIGYFDDPDATAATRGDGWLHSGDLGRIDDDGFLWVTGRKKEILITSGGKNVAPAPIEAAIKDLPIVSQAVLVGDGRKYLAALVTLDEEASRAWCREHGVEASSQLHRTPALRDAIDVGLREHVNPRFARVEQVKRFAILEEDLTPDNGMLTPTMKVRRRDVHARWSDTIESLYVDENGSG